MVSEAMKTINYSLFSRSLSSNAVIPFPVLFLAAKIVEAISWYLRELIKKVGSLETKDERSDEYKPVV